MRSIIKGIKTITLGLSLVLILGSFVAHNTAPETIQYKEADCKYRQCKAIAKSTDKRCKHCVSNADDLYCYQHD
jgi:hypothetical protein